MVRRGLKTTVIATVMAMMLAPSFSAFAQTGKSNTSGSWQVENNAWVFRNAEGQSVKGWVVYNQEWYYLNPENGQLKTGWLQLDGKWYFLSTESGAQQGRLLTGWQWIDGYCYYLMPTDDSNYGVLVVNGRTPDGYYVNQSGQWLHGENGDAVYEAGKGLPSAASSQQVAGASRALPGQVLGASRAIAAPGGGSFGGGGGGGSIGGGATVSTTGGAGTATAGTATSGTSTGTATGESAAGTAGTASESATAGEATGASTGAEANASTGAESNASGGSNETSGTTTPSTEGTGAATGTETPGTETGGNNAETPGETVTPGTSENTTQPGGTTENSGTENGGNNAEKPGETVTPGTSENTTQPGETTEKPGTENSGNNTEKPVETENPGNSENTTQPGGTTENSGTETGGNTTEKPGETETPGNPENTTQPGGTTEKPGTETGGNTEEKPGETVTPGTSENTTQPGGTTEEKPGTENGGTTTEKPGETENSGNSENTTQPGGNTENSGTETGGTTEKSGETEAPGNSENTTQPGGNTEEKPGVETGGNVEEGKKEEEGLAWPANFTIDYNSDKKCFVLTFEKESNPDEINKFLQNDIKIFVTSPENKTTEYSLGNPKQNLMRAGNIFCHDLIGEDKKSYRFNALNISRAAFEPGDNKVQIQVEGYATKEFICQVSKQQLEDGIAGLKDFGKLETSIDDDNRTGVYRVKLVSIKNLTEEQEKILENLDTLYVDDVEYHKVKVNTNQDLCQIGPPSFMLLKEGNGFSFAIGNPPKEMGSHSITIQPKDYKDIKLSYVQKEEQLVKAPEVLELKLNSGKKYYQLSFKGDDRVSKYSYLNAIKSFMVAGQTYTRMGSFHPELLNMGAKYILDDSTNAKAFEEILLFSVPTANGDKKQEIRIEAEGYKVATIPLS